MRWVFYEYSTLLLSAVFRVLTFDGLICSYFKRRASSFETFKLSYKTICPRARCPTNTGDGRVPLEIDRLDRETIVEIFWEKKKQNGVVIHARKNSFLTTRSKRFKLQLHNEKQIKN